jgi:hypothetical protein
MMMVETVGQCDTPKGNIENMLQMKQLHFPEQTIDWEYLLNKFTQPSNHNFRAPFQQQMLYFVMCGMSDHVEALAFKVWRDYIRNMIQTANFQCNTDNTVILRESKQKLPILKMNTLG